MAKRHRPVHMVFMEAGVRYEHFVLGVSLHVLEGELILPATRSEKVANLSVMAAAAFMLGVLVYNIAFN